MTRLEDLDEYAERWRAAQPDPMVDWEAATARHRTPHGWGPIAAAAAVAVIVAGVALAAATLTGSGRKAGPPASTPTPTQSPLAYDVPWVDRPAPPGTGLSPLSASPRPTDAPPCRADQLTTEHMGSQVTQDDGIVIAFKNASHSTCLLSGVPTVLAYGAGLSPYRVQANGQKAPADGPSWNMSRGETTLLWIANPRACNENQGGGQSPGPRYTSLAVTAPGGGNVTISGLSLHPACGVFTTKFYRPKPPTRYAPQPFNHLTATMTMPDSAQAGQVLTYVVTLTNNTKHSVSTNSCPGYIEWGGDSTIDVKETYALNCNSLSSIDVGQSVRFQMKVAVPADAPTGQLTLRWALLTGPDAPQAKGTVAVSGNDSPCQADQLSASALTSATAFQGQGVYSVKDAGTALSVTVTNTSRAACTLQGAPTVALLDDTGRDLGLRQDNKGFGGPPTPTALVWLAPGGRATTTLSWHTRWCHSDPNPVTVRLRLPGDGGTLTFKPAQGWAPPGCTGFAWGTLSSQPFQQ